MATRICSACGRFNDVKNLKKYQGHWKHPACASLPATFLDKVICVVCGKTTDEKKTKLRKSGFKCKECVGKAHRPDVLTRATSEIKLSENKEVKRGFPPQGLNSISCVVCSLQLQVPLGGSLVTCPNCKSLMNPNDRDLRFMNCGSCRSLLQFSLSLIRSQHSPQPILRCGNCQVSNYIPQSLLNPTQQHQQPHHPLPVASVITPSTPRVVAPTVQPSPQSLPTPRRLSSSQPRSQSPQPNVVSPPKLIAIIDEKEEKEQKTVTPVILQSLPTHRYKSPTKVSERNSDTTECSFCLCDFEEGDMIKTLPCFHMFHQNELDDWLGSHTECPLCKSSVFISE